MNLILYTEFNDIHVYLVEGPQGGPQILMLRGIEFEF